jgi:hypothetical protein
MFKRLFSAARSHLNKGTGKINKDDLLVTLMEKEHILSKYNINKKQFIGKIHELKGNHINYNDVVNVLKDYNITKEDEEVILHDISKKLNK